MIVGWLLVACGSVILVSLAIAALGDVATPQQAPTPLIAYLLIGTMLGICPLFLGWTLLRRRVPQVPSPVAPCPPSPEPAAIIPLADPAAGGLGAGGPSTRYRLSADAFPLQRRQIILRMLVLAGAAIAAGLYLSGRDAAHRPILQNIVFFTLMGGAAGVGLRSGFRRIRASLASYELEVAGAAVTLRMADRAPIVLARDQVTAIAEAPDGSLSVMGPTADRSFRIPRQLIGLAEVRGILATWQAITAQPVPRWGPWPTLLLPLTMPQLMVAAFATATPAIAVPAGLLVTITSLWCLWFIHRSSHVDGLIRRISLFLVFPAISGVLRAYTLLFP